MVLDWLRPLKECPSVRLISCISRTQPPTPDPDDVLVLEAKVVQALTRLQKSSFNSAESDGVDHSKIVEYLSRKCGFLDGDVESQVITALQTGIKKGFICGLVNGNYSLVGPSTGKMIAECYNCIKHGPKCTCILMTVGKRHCCSFKLSEESDYVKRGCAKPGAKKRMERAPKKSACKRTQSVCGDGDNACPKSGKKRKILEKDKSSTDPSVSNCDVPL